MADPRQTDEHARETLDTSESHDRTRLRRRGLIAGAAALVAGVLAKQAGDPVAAGTDGDVVLGAISPATGSVATTTSIRAAVSGNIAFIALNNFTAATDGFAAGIGGYADGANNPGVIGRNNANSGVGIWGEAPGGTGVYGHTTSAGYGVSGASASGYGVLGQSTTNHGIVGLAGSTSTAAGVIGVASYAASYGVYGAQSNGVYAGYFSGKTLVAGDFLVTGSKSAALPHPDGTHRLVYCVEAPEAWLEDFGNGTLSGGKATITIDPEFAAVIDSKDYHVFLTEHDDHNALFVTKRTATDFEVHAKGSATASGTFSYRLVARRKDKPGARLAKTTIPDPAKGLPIPGAKL